MKITEIAEAEEFGNSSPLAPTHDTPLVDPIVNEMLGASSGFDDFKQVLFTYGELRGYLRRISAAARREREAWKDAACEGIEAAIRRGCISIDAGNAAAMREALEKVEESAAEIMERVRHKDGLAFNTANYIGGIAKAALAAPPRQCDIGTAEEQVARYNAFCTKMMKQNNHCCGPCPCYKFVNGEAQPCTLLWAQMPYTEGGAK